MYHSESELIEAYSHSLDDLSPSSVRVYILGVEKFLQYLGENGITYPTSETVLCYKNDLAKSKSDNTVALYISALHRFFSWCEREGIFADIARDVKSPHVEKYNRRDALSAEQIKHILSLFDISTLEGLRNYSMFLLMASTGLRTIEVKYADVGDIHYSDGEYLLFVQGKGHSSKDASVKITNFVMTAISDYLTARGNVSPSEPLFVSCSQRNRGGRLTTRSISQVCKSAMLQAGFDSPRLTAHSLRHSAITIALTAGIDIRDVASFARHSHI